MGSKLILRLKCEIPNNFHFLLVILSFLCWSVSKLGLHAWRYSGRVWILSGSTDTQQSQTPWSGEPWQPSDQCQVPGKPEVDGNIAWKDGENHDWTRLRHRPIVGLQEEHQSKPWLPRWISGITTQVINSHIIYTALHSFGRYFVQSNPQ